MTDAHPRVPQPRQPTDHQNDQNGARMARLAGLSPADRDLITQANRPDFGRLLDLIRATGGCEEPAWITGHTTTLDTATGEVIHHYDTSGEPGGRLPIACGNRRATRCAPCSERHRADTFHLIRAGLTGGKGVPATVRDHPRVFTTLTAPSFGPVHTRRQQDGRELACRPRRDGGTCPHDRPAWCGIRHAEADPVLGQPLCPGCYDYVHAVLWHAHAGRLWDHFTRTTRRHLAARVGIARSKLAEHARLSFAKVAEYQARGAVHFHAVIRLDGPAGPTDPPPSWASFDLLTAVIASAAGAVRVLTPASDAVGQYELAFGAQLDTRPLRAFGDDQELTDEAVAGYIAKYATKSTEAAGGVDVRVTSLDHIEMLPVSGHIRAMMATCWRLGGLPEYAHLNMRAWTHTLAYRGHLATKSRAYSTTYTALRDARTQHRQAQIPRQRASRETETDAQWKYVGRGYSPGQELLAADTADDIAENRRTAREEVRRAPQ